MRHSRSRQRQLRTPPREYSCSSDRSRLTRRQHRQRGRRTPERARISGDSSGSGVYGRRERGRLTSLSVRRSEQARDLQNRSRSRIRRSVSRARGTRSRDESGRRFTIARYNRLSRSPERSNRRTPYSHARERGHSQRSRSRVFDSHRDDYRSNRSILDRELMLKFADMIDSLTSSNNIKKETFTNTNVIPEFDPSLKNQTIDKWLMKVNECAILYEWTDRQTIHYALPKLVGIAKQWYEGLPSVLLSWGEWQRKLRSAFPANENFGQMMQDMLDRRVKFGESLETYFYEKVTLINRLEVITGRRAVECILHGIDDRSVRLGAEAAQFDDCDKLLAYLRKTNVRRVDSNARKVHAVTKPVTKSNISSKPIIRCYNCKEEGHPVSKCPKPIKKCNKCSAVGHVEAECFRQIKATNSKTVMKINQPSTYGSNKYVQDVFLNDIKIKAFIDLGSELTLIRESEAKDIFKQWDTSDKYPMLGFGGAVVNSIGSCQAEIKIQDVKATVKCVIVPDLFLKHPVLIGQTFTEQPHVKIIKTNKELLFENSDDDRCIERLELRVSDCAVIREAGLLDIYCSAEYTGSLYISGGFRGEIGKEYILEEGVYSIVKGKGSILTIPISKPISFKKDDLIARAEIVSESFGIHRVNKIESAVELYQPFTLDELIVGDIPQQDKQRLLELVNRYRDCFATCLQELGCTNIEQMNIDLKDNEPVVYRPYRMSASERQEVQSMVDELIVTGIVRESNSPYASPIILVRKKTGDKRLCIDYRQLNKKTIKQHYPLPCMEDQMNRLADNSFYSALDLASGYYQIELTEQSKAKTAFVTPDGQWEFNRMPFGLANAPAIFQRTVNKALGSLKFNTAVAYMDDILVPSKTVDDGLQKLEVIFDRIRAANLTLKLSKCHFFQTSVDFLGFEVSANGIRPGSKKTDAVHHFPVPKNVHNVRQFIGLASFFRKFIKNFATIAKPLTGLLKNNAPWKWGEEQHQAFENLKTQLVSRPVLALYNPSLYTELHTDASKWGVGGMLLQKQEGGDLKPVAYYSRQTSPEEQHFSAYELETLAVVSSLTKFRTYLLGMSFTIVTDCNSLRATFTKRDMLPRVARWWSLIQEFDCDVKYKSGKGMVHVDALSRNPLPEESTELDFPTVFVITNNWLQTVQSDDSEVERIKNILLDPKNNNVVEVKNNYCLKNNNVFKITDNGLKWLVPRGVRWQILRSCHDDIGHFSTDKTYEKVSENYWFPKMRKFVKKYVGACLECAHSKAPSGKKSGYLHPIPKVPEPFHTLHADHLGPFNLSKRKNRYILVIIDAYTKFIVLKAVKSTKANITIKIFREYFGTFSVPTRLITDRYSSFTGKKLKVFLKSLGVQHVMNAVATPRANGQVERYNRTILDALTAMNHGRSEELWDDKIIDVQWGLNNTVNKGTGKTPAEVLFGLKLKGITEGKIITVLQDEGTLENTGIDVEGIRSEVNDYVIDSQAKQKERFDRNRSKPRTFAIGDLVRVERNILCPGKSKKLISKCFGPYRVTEVLQNDRYKVEDTPLTKKRGKACYKGIHPVERIHPWLSFKGIDDSDSSEDENNEGNMVNNDLDDEIGVDDVNVDINVDMNVDMSVDMNEVINKDMNKDSNGVSMTSIE